MVVGPPDATKRRVAALLGGPGALGVGLLTVASRIASNRDQPNVAITS